MGEPEVEIIVEEEVEKIVEVKDESEFGASGTNTNASIIDHTHSASVSPSDKRANCKLAQESVHTVVPDVATDTADIQACGSIRRNVNCLGRPIYFLFLLQIALCWSRGMRQH